MTTNAKSIQGAFGEGSHSDDRGSYMQPVRPHCKAEGCYCFPAVLDNPDTGEGLCAFHRAAHDEKSWGRITRMINSDPVLALRKALLNLNKFLLSDKVFDAGLETKHIICVQRLAIAAGLDRDAVSRRTLTSWSGEEFPEGGRAYYCRVHAALEAHVVAECDGQHAASSAAVMRAAAEAIRSLQAISAKAAAVMGGPA